MSDRSVRHLESKVTAEVSEDIDQSVLHRTLKFRDTFGVCCSRPI